MTFVFVAHFKTNEHLILRWQTEDSLYLDVAGRVRKYLNKEIGGMKKKQKKSDCGKRRLLCVRTKQS